MASGTSRRFAVQPFSGRWICPGKLRIICPSEGNPSVPILEYLFCATISIFLTSPLLHTHPQVRTSRQRVYWFFGVVEIAAGSLLEPFAGVSTWPMQYLPGRCNIDLADAKSTCRWRLRRAEERHRKSSGQGAGTDAIST